MQDDRILDDLRCQADTYYRAWRRAEERVEALQREIQRLKHVTGQPDVLYAADVMAGAGITHSTLRSWRRRYPDFPTPLSEVKPLAWNRAEILNWMQVHNRKWIETIAE